MHVRNGEQYMAENRASIAKAYAYELLFARVGPKSLLAPNYDQNEMTTRQRVCLSALYAAETPLRFSNMLRACHNSHAITPQAYRFFSGIRSKPMKNKVSSRLLRESVPPSSAMQVDSTPAAPVAQAAPASTSATTSLVAASPARVVMNTHSTAQPPITVRNRAKRAKSK